MCRGGCPTPLDANSVHDGRYRSLLLVGGRCSLPSDRERRAMRWGRSIMPERRLSDAGAWEYLDVRGRSVYVTAGLVCGTMTIRCQMSCS